MVGCVVKVQHFPFTLNAGYPYSSLACQCATIMKMMTTVMMIVMTMMCVD